MYGWMDDVFHTFFINLFKVSKEAAEAAIKTLGGTNAVSMKIIETPKTALLSPASVVPTQKRQKDNEAEPKRAKKARVTREESLALTRVPQLVATSMTNVDDVVILDFSSDEGDYSKVDDELTIEGETEYEVASASATGMVQPVASTAGSQSKKPHPQAHIQPTRLPAQGPLQTARIRPTAMRTSAAASMRSTELVPRPEAVIETSTVEETPNLAMVTPRQDQQGQDDLVPENAKKAKKQQTAGSPDDETEMPRSNKAYVRKRKPLKLTINNHVPENDDDDEWRPNEASRGKRRRNQEQENQPVASASVTDMVQPVVSTAGSQLKKPHQQAHIQPTRLPAQGPLQTATIQPTAMRTSAAASMRSTVGPSMVALVSPSTSEFVPSSEEETVEETPNLAMVTPRQDIKDQQGQEQVGAIEEEMFTRTTDGHFQCVLCFKQTETYFIVKNKWNFSQHLKSHSKCEKCGKNFAGPRAYNTRKEHVAICKAKNGKKTKKVFMCQWCYKDYHYKSKLSKHQLTCKLKKK
jgi:hypothetical protein